MPALSIALNKQNDDQATISVADLLRCRWSRSKLRLNLPQGTLHLIRLSGHDILSNVCALRGSVCIHRQVEAVL